MARDLGGGADDSARHAHDDRVGRHVVTYKRRRADESSGPDLDRRHDRGVCTDDGEPSQGWPLGARVGRRMRIVRQDCVRKDPDELFDEGILRDENAAMDPRVVANLQSALNIRLRSDLDVDSELRSFADRDVVSGREVVADRDACVDHTMAADDGAPTDPTWLRLVRRTVVEVLGGLPQDYVRPDKRFVAQRDAVVNDRHGTYRDPRAESRVRAHPARLVDGPAHHG